MNSHEEYLAPAQDVPRGWQGSLVCILTAQPEIGIEHDLGIYLALTDDTCEVRAATAPELAAADFALRATSGTWGDVLAGYLGAVDALINGQLILQRGDRDTLLAGLETFQGLLDAPDELSGELFPLLRDALLLMLPDTPHHDATEASGAAAPDQRGLRRLTVVHDAADAQFEDARLEALIAVFEHWCGKLPGPVQGGVRRGRAHTTFSIAPGQAEMFLRLETIARALDPGWWQIQYAAQ